MMDNQFNHSGQDKISAVFYKTWLLCTYIIFSTIDLVSPSRSDNLEFSGWTLLVLISGSVVTNFDHHSILFIFSRLIMMFLKAISIINVMILEFGLSSSKIYSFHLKEYLLSSRFHTHSSALTSCNNSPSIIDSVLPLIATYCDWKIISENQGSWKGLKILLNQIP